MIDTKLLHKDKGPGGEDALVVPGVQFARRQRSSEQPSAYAPFSGLFPELGIVISSKLVLVDKLDKEYADAVRPDFCTAPGCSYFSKNTGRALESPIIIIPGPGRPLAPFNSHAVAQSRSDSDMQMQSARTGGPGT